jgi:uncharacterized protein (TIGR04255 family)
MAVSFANAPLVEIIAEVRWNPVAMPQSMPAGLTVVEANQDRFFNAFSDLAAKNGYPRSERMVPVGFPVPIGQAIWRFRPLEGATLWQVGPGVFTVNAVPPYKSWEAFSPHLRTGLALMLEARDSPAINFNVVSLRYVDAFGADMLAGLSQADFLCDKLGFQLQVPKGLTQRKDASQSLTLNATVEFSLDNAMQLVVTVGPGAYQGEQVVLMTTMVYKQTSTDATLEALMDVFESAHAIIHDAFLDMTAPIHAQMHPIEAQ